MDDHGEGDTGDEPRPKPKGRQPDYILSVLNKDTGRKNTTIGAAWKQPDGSISIRLGYLVVIPNDPALEIRLFPNTFGRKATDGDGE